MLFAAFNSAALTLGRMRGAAIVGQPLEVVIPVQLDSEENASALCVEADVFYADARQGASRVRVSVEALPEPQAASVRIVSSSPVDEPIVTVYLKAGCGQKSTRRYVLLADVPSETAAPGPTAAALAGTPMAAPMAAPQVALAVVPAAPLAVATAPAGTLPPPVSRGETAKPLSRRSEPGNAPAEKTPVKNPEKTGEKAGEKTADKSAGGATGNAPRPARAGVAGKPKAALPPPQPRLKLDSLVMLAERVASLESSPAVPMAEVLRDSQKLQSLEADMKALVALAARNEANLMALQTRLQQAEAERLPTQWFYGLLALMAACLAAMAFFWRRPKAGVPVEAPAIANEGWWSGSRAAPLAPAQPAGQLLAASEPAPLAADAHEAASARTAAHADGPKSGPSLLSPSLSNSVSHSVSQSLSPPSGRGSGHASLPDGPESEVDVSLVEMSESNFDKLMASGQAQSALRRGPLPPAAEISRPQALQVEPARSINSEEIFDIRQQAEFFVSLGQTDQAVRILENRIIDNGESSPLIYLDLLAILHAVGLKSDFRQFREDFNLLFNSKVPEFSAFKEEGKSLEDYPHVLAHIMALWPKPKVLMVIEASIFRDPWDDKSPPFELAAFRDLLLLHAIAQGIVSQASAVCGPSALRAAKGAPVALGPGGAHGSGLQTRAGFSQVSAPAALAFGGEDLAAPQTVGLDLDLTQADGPSLRLRSMPNRGIDFPSTMPGIGPAAIAGPGPSATPVPSRGNGFLPDHLPDCSQDNLPVPPVAGDNLINLDLLLLDDVPPLAGPKH